MYKRYVKTIEGNEQPIPVEKPKEVAEVVEEKPKARSGRRGK